MFKTGAAKFGAFADNTTSSYTFGKTSTTTKDSNTKSSGPKFEPTDFVPKRFGLKYDPPSIILEYLIPSTGKLYHHKLKMPQLKANSDTNDTLEALKKKHHHYFAGNKISDTQIKTLVDKLKKKLEGTSTSTFITGNDFGDNKKDNRGFGSLPTKQTITSAATSKGLGSLDAGKDKFDSGKQNNSKTLSLPEKKKEDKKSVDAGNNFWDFEDVEDLEEDNEVDYNTTNLNKLSKEELDRHKAKMNNTFSKNQKKPGDAGFIYDKQEEFVPCQDNEWDEDF